MKGLKNMRGFTMIEVLVVITMIGIMATIFVPKITSQLDKPKKSRAMIEIKTMKNALDIYFAENNAYPITAENVAKVMNENGVFGGKFGTDKAIDPWGKPYYFTMEDKNYTIWSEGSSDKTGDDIFTKHDDIEIYLNDQLEPQENMPTANIYSNTEGASEET